MEERQHRARARRSSEAPLPPPSSAHLHEAALAYLARGAATADSVAKTLGRRIDNWARRALRAGADVDDVERQASQAKDAIPFIVTRLAAVGLVDDAAFAESKARRMSAAGRSQRAIRAHLARKGVTADTVRDAVPRDGSADLHAAIVFARKRRIGPFARHDERARDQSGGRRGRGDLDPKALGALARAGFDFSVCERVLQMTLEDAEDRLIERGRL